METFIFNSVHVGFYIKPEKHFMIFLMRDEELVSQYLHC